jgi:hypothetical protein
MTRPSMIQMMQSKRVAQAGVDYSPRTGARCPWCGERAKIYKTMPWEDNTRVRYHRCQQRGCVLQRLEVTIKSIEVDQVAESSG